MFCSSRVRAFNLILLLEQAILFASIFLKSLKLIINEDGYSFSTHSVLLLGNCSFLSKSIPRYRFWCLLVRKRTVLHLDVRGKVSTSVGVAFKFPDFELDLLRNFGFQSELILVPRVAILTCIVRCGKWIRQCLLSMTRLLCLIKFNPLFDPVKLFVATKRSAQHFSNVKTKCDCCYWLL